MRSSLVLFLAVACSHAAPPPSAPATAAPPPAATGAAAAEDLVSPLTAAGREAPTGLDWGPKGKQPVSELGFQNVKLLGSVSGDRLMAAMQSMQANLGVKCVHCHVTQRGQWGLDDKEPKRRAREMIDMTTRINGMLLQGKPEVTCWMCHRGELKPLKWEGGLPEPAPFFPKLTEEEAKKPAGEVFKNMKALAQVPAGRIGGIMSMFAKSLGVKCTNCHVEKDFASDAKKEKLLAREMLAMTGMVGKNFYPGKGSPVSCITCHHGEAEPKRKPDVAWVDPEDKPDPPRGG